MHTNRFGTQEVQQHFSFFLFYFQKSNFTRMGFRNAFITIMMGVSLIVCNTWIWFAYNMQIIQQTQLESEAGPRRNFLSVQANQDQELIDNDQAEVSYGSHDGNTGNAEAMKPERQRKLLTLFTTFKPGSEWINIQSNTIWNWAQFYPDVQPVLYVNPNLDPLLIQRAKDIGWEVYLVPRANEYGMPFIHDLFAVTDKMADSHFIGYANGDILFNKSLTSTLKSVLYSVTQSSLTMVVGKRADIKINASSQVPFYSIQDVTNAGNSSKLDNLHKQNITDFILLSNHDNGIMYQFPWDRISQNLVVGRPGYDNYLVAKAIEHSIKVIDATNTVLPLHQKPISDYSDNNLLTQKDKEFNLDLMGHHDHYNTLSSRISHKTAYNTNGLISIM